MFEAANEGGGVEGGECCVEGGLGMSQEAVAPDGGDNWEREGAVAENVVLGFGGAGPEEGVAEVADAFRRPTFNTTVSNVEGIAPD